MNKIKSEVKIAVNTELSLLKNSNALILVDICEPVQPEKILIASLNSEIAFLRKELESKDTIIKMLLNNRNQLNNKKENETNALTSKCMIEKNMRDKDELNKISCEGCEDKPRKSTPKKNKRNITILGDSLIKDMKSFKMRQGLSADEKVYIKFFPGAKNG